MICFVQNNEFYEFKNQFLKRGKRMSKDYYLNELYPSIGEMYYMESLGVSLHDTLLAKIKIKQYEKNEEGFTGVLDVSESRFAEYVWLGDSIPAEGSGEGEEFEIAGKLSATEFSFGDIRFQVQDGKITLYNRKTQFNDQSYSGAEISGNGLFIIGEGKYAARMSFIPFQDNEETLLEFSFDEQSKGISMQEFLHHLTGDFISVGKELPSYINYQEIVFLKEVTLWVDSEKVKRPQNCLKNVSSNELDWKGEMLIGMVMDLERFRVASPWFSLNALSMNLVCRPEYSVSIQSIDMEMCILDVKTQTSSINPFYNFEIEVDNTEDRTLEELFHSLKLSVPDFLKNLILKNVYLRFNPGEDAYYASVNLTKKDKGNEWRGSSLAGGSCTLTWQNLRLALSQINGKINAVLNMSLSIMSEEELLCQFLLGGTWESGIVTFSGSLIYMDVSASIMKLYEAFFGESLQGAFPEIEILSLQVAAKAQHSVSVESFSGTLLVTADPSLIGTEFSFQADVRCTSNQFYLAGQFVFQDYFQVRGVFEKEKDTAAVKWSFWMLLGKLEIGISYDTGQKQLSGEINQSYSMGDMIDYLLRLLNPSDSFERTGIWSFLNDISLKGTKLVYSYADKSLRLTIKLSGNYSQSFLQMDDLAVIMDSTGVRVQIVGNFMGTIHTKDQPLTFDPNNPPEVEGCGLSVSYLLFGKGIQLPKDVSGKDVSSTLSILEENFYGEMDFSTLTVAEKGGNFLGLDVDIAQTVNVKLLYLEDNSCCGGRFELYGDKAGALKGLSAELSYSRLQGGLGMFSGRFAPPQALRNIRLGALEFSVGSMGADIYSNGDFSLDLGYPYNQNFQRAFSFRYGVFSGSAGVYLKKGAITLTNKLPLREKGYFTNVLQMGIGMRLRIGSSFQKSILSAEASLVMQGYFEGVYARWMPDQDKTGRDYYELRANVLFDGVIQGRVDFGIVGAAVSLKVRSTIGLTLSSDAPMRADVTFKVKANASVKVCFVRVNFSFSLDAHLKYNFDTKKGNTLFAENARRITALSIPASLCGEGPVRIPLTLIPVFTYYSGRPAVALLLMAEEKVFDQVIDQMAKVLWENHALRSGEMQLFRAERLSRTPEEIEKILGSLFTFVISAPETIRRGENEEQGGVLIPLPEWMTILMERYYENGQRDVSKRNLQTYETADDNYRQSLENYYAKTEVDTLPYSAENERGVEAYLFADFFELVGKAIQGEQENSILNGRDFSAENLTEEQYENIRGVVNRFFLGGRRGPTKSGPIPVDGLIRIAGAQIEFSTDRMVRHVYHLQKNADAPDWIQLANGKEEVSFEMGLEEIKDQLPAASYTGDIFCSEPDMLPAWQKMEETIAPMLVFRTDRYYYFEAGSGINAGTKLGNCDSETKWGYGAVFYLSLLREEDSDSIYRISGYRSTKYLKKWVQEADKIQDIVFLYQEEGETDYKEWIPAESSVVCMKNVTSGVSETEKSEGWADITDPQKWLAMVSESMDQNGEYFLYSSAPVKETTQKEIELQIVLRFIEQNTYEEWKPLFYADQKGLELVNKEGRYKQILEQGMVGIHADIDTSTLTDLETKLLECYGGMGAQLEDQSGKTLTNETPSFFGDPQENKWVSYDILFPYAKALSLDQTDIYKGIGSGQAYVFRLFWSDILGNRMETGKAVSYTPKYQDRLMDPDEFPGISIIPSVTKEGTLRLKWEFNGALTPNVEMQNHLTYGCVQLRRPDVTIILQSPLLEREVVLDKALLLAYLEKLEIGKPGGEYCCEYPLKKISASDGLLLFKAEASLTVKRDSQLCESYDESVNISTAQTTMTVTGDQDEASGLGIGFLSSAEGNYVLTGLNICGEKALVSFGDAYYFGFAPLPVVSGTYTGNDGAETLNAVSLRGILNQYLADLEQIISAKELFFCYQQEDLRPYLSRIDTLVKDTAKALASRVTPLYQYPAGDISQEAMQQYAEEFFLKNMFTNRKEIVFVQMKGTGNVLAKNLVLRGTMGKGDGFPVWYDLSKGSDILCTALEVTDEYDTDQDTFSVRYLYEKEKKVLLTPMNPDSASFNILIEKENKVQPLLEKTPELPLLCSCIRNEDSFVLELHLNMSGEDVLLLRKGGQKAKLRQRSLNSPVYDMEQYRKKSGALMTDSAPESRKHLIELMEQYIKALAQFEYKVQDEEADIYLRFDQYDKTGFQKLSVKTQIAADMRIYIAKIQGKWEEMTKQDDAFYANDPIDTEGGVFLKIELTGIDMSSGSMQIQRSREFVDSAPYALSQEHMLYTPQIMY